MIAWNAGGEPARCAGMRLHPILLVATVVPLSACSSGDGTSGSAAAGIGVAATEVGFAAGPTVAVDPSGTSATVTVRTEVELACAVVYGRNGDVGEGIATDSDMGGGAHTDHAAVLTGLRPDTEYTYRLQGSGADGRPYRSEPLTFRTPAAGAPAAAGGNVALGAEVVEVSSEFSDGFAGELAVDGNAGTAWSSAGDGDDAFLTLDLGAVTEVSGIGFRSRAMDDGTSIVESFTVTVDGGAVLGPFDAGQGPAVHEVELRGRQLRFDADTTTGGNTGAAEIEVYAG